MSVASHREDVKELLTGKYSTQFTTLCQLTLLSIFISQVYKLKGIPKLL